MNKTILILGLTPQGLSLLRLLSRNGVSVIAFYHSKKNVGTWSKYGRKIYFESIDHLKRLIKEELKNSYKPLCYITSGEILAMILRDYPELYEICDVISGPYSVINILSHKDQMYEFAQRKGLKVASYLTLDKVENHDLSFPIFIKRNYEIPLFFKAAIIRNGEELNYYLDKIRPIERKDVILQEFIQIPSEDLLEISSQVFYSEGIAKGMLIMSQKRRLNKGLTSYTEEIDDLSLQDKVGQLCLDFMSGCKYTGFAEFEFMHNKKTGELFFVEVNTRTCGLQSSFVYKFENVCDVILNPHHAPLLRPRMKKVRWMNIQRDIRARFQKNNYHNIFDIFHSCFDILDFHDIKPFFRQFLQ